MPASRTWSKPPSSTTTTMNPTTSPSSKSSSNSKSLPSSPRRTRFEQEQSSDGYISKLNGRNANANPGTGKNRGRRSRPQDQDQSHSYSQPKESAFGLGGGRINRREANGGERERDNRRSESGGSGNREGQGKAFGLDRSRTRPTRMDQSGGKSFADRQTRQPSSSPTSSSSLSPETETTPVEDDSLDVDFVPNEDSTTNSIKHGKNANRHLNAKGKRNDRGSLIHSRSPSESPSSSPSSSHSAPSYPSNNYTKHRHHNTPATASQTMQQRENFKKKPGKKVVEEKLEKELYLPMSIRVADLARMLDVKLCEFGLDLRFVRAGIEGRRPRFE